MVNSTGRTMEASRDADETVDTRERLIRAAIEVFLEKGYGGTRVQDIARRAGFTSGALYVHFPSRTALLDEAIIREGDTILRSMVTSLEQVDPGEGRIAQMLSKFSTIEPTDLDRLLLEALALASRDPEAREMLAEPLGSFVGTVRRQVTASQAGGLLDADLDPEALTYVMMSWVFGAVMTKSLALIEVTAAQVRAVGDRMTVGLLTAR